MTSKCFFLFFTLFTVSSLNLAWAENRIDTQHPDAPELSAYGNYSIDKKKGQAHICDNYTNNSPVAANLAHNRVGRYFYDKYAT